MASIVVMRRTPIDPTGSLQERTGAPSTCTVHAPHWAIPHPNFVPVSASTSRRTQRGGMSGGTSTLLDWPLTFTVIISNLAAGPSASGRRARGGESRRESEVADVAYDRRKIADGLLVLRSYGIPPDRRRQMRWAFDAAYGKNSSR
jgi:hypothetical protein